MVAFKKANKLTWDAISAEIDVPKRTITNYVYESGQLSGAVLRGMALKYGVSSDWLLTGNGPMLLGDTKPPANPSPTPPISPANGTVREPISHYQTDNHGRPRPLMPYNAVFDPKQLQDYFWLVASCIEQSMMEHGAVPGQDYTRLDLYKLAQPLVTAKFGDGNGLEILVFEAGQGQSREC